MACFSVGCLPVGSKTMNGLLRQLKPLLKDALKAGREVWGRMGMCICMAESLCCSPETITTLLIGYTPIQNKKLILKKRRSLLSQHLQKAVVPGNNFFDGYFPFRKLPTCKNVQITEITFRLIAHSWTTPCYLR